MSHKMEDRQGVINRADKGVFLNSLPSYNNQESHDRRREQMNIFPTREQTSRERYTRDLQKIEDERFIQNKISEMQEFIKGKSAQNQIKALEFFITELNPEVFYNFEDFLLSYDFTVEQIKIEIKKAGGIFPFYYDIVWKKFNSDPFKEGFPLTGWIIDSFGLLFDEAAKLYKRIIFEIKDTSPAADEEGNREKSFKILAKKIGWKPDTDIKPLIKIIQDNTDYLWNYDFIKSDKINLIGETEFQQITAILFFQNLLNEEFITHISRKKLNDLIMETFNFSFDVNNTNLSKTRNKINDGALAPKSKPIEERLTIKLAI